MQDRTIKHIGKNRMAFEFRIVWKKYYIKEIFALNNDS